VPRDDYVLPEDVLAFNEQQALSPPVVNPTEIVSGQQ
jgi:hypothetical protein